MASCKERAVKDIDIAIGSHRELSDIRFDLAPDLPVIGWVLRHHVRKRKGLGHCMRIRCICRRGLMATIHCRMLATVVAQLCPPALGNPWVRIELIGAFLTLGIL